jgi:hypothetical protein
MKAVMEAQRKESYFSWGKKGRLPGGGSIWVFQIRNWKVILSSRSKGMKRAVPLCTAL